MRPWSASGTAANGSGSRTSLFPEAGRRRLFADGSLDQAIDVHQRIAIERLLAASRVLKALVIAVSLGSNVGALHSPVSKLLAGGYLVHAGALLMAVGRRPQVMIGASSGLHALDWTWVIVLTTVSGGPSSHAFPMFAFVLVAAAHRWGLRRTLQAAAAVVAVALGRPCLP